MSDAYHEHEDRELIAEHEAHPERFAKVQPRRCDCGEPMTDTKRHGLICKRTVENFNARYGTDLTA